MTRLSPIEKLARDIAWAKLGGEHSTETKAAWWKRQSDLGRHLYIGEANDFLFIVKKLKPIRILTMVNFK